MFNATQTYKDRLIQKIKSLEYDYGDIEWNYALKAVINIIESNDLDPVVHEPHKVNTCKN